MYWFSYDNGEIPYKIDIIGNPYINHPRASHALHTRVSTCYTILVCHMCATREPTTPLVRPPVILLQFPLTYKLKMGVIFIQDFKMFKIQNFKFSARLGVVAPHARVLPARPPARPTTRTRGPPTRRPTRALAHMGGTEQMPSSRK
jgi:hypothetical protein